MQALRLPRAVQLIPPLKKFCLKLFGGGLKFFVVFLIVSIFLVWFAVVSMQIFGYLDTEESCERFGSDQFGDFFSVSLYTTQEHIVLHSLTGFEVNVSISNARRMDRAHE